MDWEHAKALLTDRTTEDELRAAVAAADGSAVAGGIRLERHSLDYDVPIAGILEVDGCNTYRVSGAASAEVRLYADLWGEAYDRSYGGRLRLVDGDTRETLWRSPPEAGRADPARWGVAIARLSALIGVPLDAAAMSEAIAVGWPPPLAPLWRALVERY